MTATLHVSTLDSLMAALAGARGGETILLAGGNYGALSLGAKSGFPIIFPSTVTIASADPDDPAVFSRMALSRAGNLTLDGLVFDYTFNPADTVKVRPFEVSGTDITIRNAVFSGDVAQGVSDTADGFGWGMGLSVRGATRFTLENSEISGFHRGVVVADSKDVHVIGNDVHSLRSDGMNFANVQGVLIERNHLHDFTASDGAGDHRDMIQFWTNGTRSPSTDIVIRDNVLDIGAGGWTQSIFMRNEEVDTGRAGTEMFYRNVLIEGNTIYNSHLHGIHLGASAGVVVRDNAVLFANAAMPPGAMPSGAQIPRINVASISTDVTITGNVTSHLDGWRDQAGWTVGGNAFVQPSDPRAPGFYGDVFVTSSTGLGADGTHAFSALPGAMIDRLGAGPATLYPDGPLDALFHVTRDPDNAAFRILDATASRADGDPLPAGASYLWTFADGTTATGAVVRHPFPDAGQQAVTLSIRLPDGRTATDRADVTVAGASLVSLGATGFVAEAFGAERLVTPVADGVLTLGAPGVAATVGRSHLREMFEADNFEIALTLAAAHPGTSGELFRLHGSFIAAVNSQGELYLRVFTEGREVKLTTSGANLGDTAPHAVRIRVEDGQLSVTVDGTVVGSAAVPAPVAFPGNHSLTFGNPSGGANFAGTLSAFAVDVNVADHASAAVARDAILAHQMELQKQQAPLADPVAESARSPEPAPEAASEVADDSQAGDIAVAPGPSTTLILPELDRFVLDIEALATGQAPRQQRLVADAAVVEGPNGLAIRMDGKDDHLVLGRLTAFEQSDRIGFAVTFTPDAEGLGGPQRLVWNHLKVGATVADGLVNVQVATANEGFKGFTIRDPGVAAGVETRLTVLVDAVEDRLQVLIDDRVALDHQGTDFEIVGAGSREWGWTLGTASSSRFFHGEISDFSICDRFDFLDGPQPDPWAA